MACIGELIGRAGIENREIDGVTCCEIGYLIRRNMQHKGYAYEACQAILEYASDELGIQEMFAVIDKTNEPSRKLAQKLGFSVGALEIHIATSRNIKHTIPQLYQNYILYIFPFCKIFRHIICRIKTGPSKICPARFHYMIRHSFSTKMQNSSK